MPAIADRKLSVYITVSFALCDNVKTVGNSNSRFTINTYVHATEELKKESISRMDAFIDGTSEKQYGIG